MTTAPDRSATDEAIDLVGLYRRMVTIREFDTVVPRLVQMGRIKGTAHSAVGQEAVAVGACAALRPTDSITSTHRGHGHAIAKGVDVDGDDGRAVRPADRDLRRQGRLDAPRRLLGRDARRERRRGRRLRDRDGRGARRCGSAARTAWSSASSATARSTRARSSRTRTTRRSTRCP